MQVECKVKMQVEYQVKIQVNAALKSTQFRLQHTVKRTRRLRVVLITDLTWYLTCLQTWL